MPSARDEHTFHDAGFGGHINYLSPEQHREITRERKRVDKEEKKYRDNLAEGFVKPGPPNVLDPFIDAEVSKASVILTPKQEQLQRLGLVEQPDGSVLHITEVRKREAARTPDETGVSPEEREQMEQYLAADEDEDDESFWNNE